MTVRYRRQQPQPTGGPAMTTCHVGGRPGLVDKDQVVGVERGLAADKGPSLLGYIGAILLGGV